MSRSVPPTSVSVDDAPTVEVVAGADSTLVCRADGARPAASISWYRDGVEVAGSVSVEIPGAGKLTNVVSRLSVNPALSDHGAKYSCHGVNGATLHPLTSDVTLNVLCTSDYLLVTFGEYSS